MTKALARVLDCADGDALDMLLDSASDAPGAGRSLAQPPARRARPRTSSHPKCAQRAAEIRRRRGFAENEWGDFLEAKRWIKGSAALRLRQEAERRSWPIDAAPRRFWRASSTPPNGRSRRRAPTPTKAILTVCSGSRRSGGVLTLLPSPSTEQAESHFADAVQAAPSVRGLGMLQGWFDLYERQAIARGLSRLCGGTRVLATLLNGARTEDKGITGGPESGEYLTVNPGTPFTRRSLLSPKKREYVTFSVMCKVRSVGVYLPILERRRYADRGL